MTNLCMTLRKTRSSRAIILILCSDIDYITVYILVNVLRIALFHRFFRQHSVVMRSDTLTLTLKINSIETINTLLFV